MYAQSGGVKDGQQSELSSEIAYVHTDHHSRDTNDTPNVKARGNVKTLSGDLVGSGRGMRIAIWKLENVPHSHQFNN